ncbi:MAG: hypothetical protein JRN21_09690 [Nitrososphaerota archaeon]|nr:hypothetical protein [Nitrososphaerota archaeon]
MPMQGIMFRPKYKRGARYARLHKCVGCNKWLYEISEKDRYIFVFDEGSVKGAITFWRCSCGTTNWTHRLIETAGDWEQIEREIEVGAHKIDTIPEWTEGDPSKGEMDWTRKGVDSRTMLPYGFAEDDMGIIRDGLQALWNNTHTRELVEQQLIFTLNTASLADLMQGNSAISDLVFLLNARGESLSRLDYLLKERWFFNANGEIKIFDSNDNY